MRWRKAFPFKAGSFKAFPMKMFVSRRFPFKAFLTKAFVFKRFPFKADSSKAFLTNAFVPRRVSFKRRASSLKAFAARVVSCRVLSLRAFPLLLLFAAVCLIPVLCGSAAAGTGTSYTGMADAGWFQTQKSIPAGWVDKRVYLKITGLQCDAVVWVNGVKTGEVVGPDGRVDVTGAVQPGRDASIRLWVTNWWENTENTRADDPFRDLALKTRTQKNYGGDQTALMKKLQAGIAGAVTLEAVPYSAEIDNVQVETSYRQQMLKLHVEYDLHAQLPGGQFSVSVSDATNPSNGTAGLPSATVAIADGGAATDGAAAQELDIPWSNPHLWEAGAAYLYNVQVKILDAGGNEVDSVPATRFGFREVWTEGKDLMLNGHPLKLRMAPFVYGVPQMVFYEGMGCNALEVQPNGDAWYTENGVFPTNVQNAGTKELLDAADERGWVVLMPAPSVNAAIVNNLSPDDAQAQQKYLTYFQTWSREMDRQNRPSIIAWSPSMNQGGTYTATPDKIGQQAAYTPSPWLTEAGGLIKTLDTTRLVYNHDGGQTGDIQALNTYLNFAPLQERENWLSDWSETGTAPYSAIEFGEPFSANFFKPAVVPQYTEYSAIYLGDEAYALEQDSYITNSLDTVKQANTSQFSGSDYFASKGYSTAALTNTAYGKLMDLFVRRTNTAWRVWGINGGMFPWIFDVGFGTPPGHVFSRNGFTYTELNGTTDVESLKNRPDWANSLYDDFSDTMQPLQVSIGGPSDDFTTKDHDFTAGETVTKSIDTVWDGPGQKTLRVSWQVTMGGAVVAGGDTGSFTMDPGTVSKKDFSFTAPDVGAKTSAKIQITVTGDALGKTPATDTFDLTFFPPASPVGTLQSRWGIYDPEGQTTAELAKLGVSPTPVQLGDSLTDIDVLVVGYKALSHNGGQLPFTAADVAAGKRVLFFEQDLASLQNLGFRAEDVVPRYTFPRAKDSPILTGIDDADLINWRGAGQLVAATSSTWPLNHAYHWGNDGSVASVVVETPDKGGFTSLLDCEYDLSYSPLLEQREGGGEILYSQLDLTGRIGVEPAATRLASNLIQALDTAAAQPRAGSIAYLGGNSADLSMLAGLGLSYRQIAAGDVGGLDARDVLVLPSDGLGGLTNLADIQSFAARGGTVFVLPQSQSQFAQAKAAGLPWDVTLTAQTMTRVAPDAIESVPLLRGVGPQVLHWRTFLPLSPITQVSGGGSPQLLTDGLLMQVGQGSGKWIFDQIDWTGLYDSSDNLRRTRWNSAKLYSELFANLGVQALSAVPSQMLAGEHASVVNVADWQVAKTAYDIDPATKTVNGNSALPALGAALEAETWLGGTGHSADFVQQSMNASGFLDMGAATGAAPKAGKAAVAVTYVYSSQARDTTVSLSSDWWCVFKVNGAAAVDQSVTGRTPNAAKPGEVNVKVHLNAGWNQLEMKVGSGSGTFGFWCTITDPGDLRVSPTVAAPSSDPTDIPPAGELKPDAPDSTLLYTQAWNSTDDPYRFTAW